MTLNKQLINLLGILVAVIVLVAGLALIALPLYSQAQTVEASARTVAQTNSVFQAQIDVLGAANDRIGEIDQELAGLRGEIAAAPQLDDVYEIVDAAAQRADVRIETITAEDAAPWIPRTALDADGNPVEVEPAPAATEAPADGVATDTAPEEPAAPAPTTPEDAPQQQVLVTVTIDLAQPYAIPAATEPGADAEAPTAEAETDPAAARAAATAQAQKAAVLVDDFGGGPRLLAPVNVDYTGGKLTISLLTFIRTEATP